MEQERELFEWVKGLLATQRAMCADAFWNNRFSFMDKITPNQCKEMMLYIENYDAPEIPSPISESELQTMAEEKYPLIPNPYGLDNDKGINNVLNIQKREAFIAGCKAILNKQ